MNDLLARLLIGGFAAGFTYLGCEAMGVGSQLLHLCLAAVVGLVAFFGRDFLRWIDATFFLV